MKHYDSHPYADIYELHEGKPIQELAESIRLSGQHHKIILAPDNSNGGTLKIADGRRRYLACVNILGIEPTTEVFKGNDVELLDAIEGINSARRHYRDATERAETALRFKEARNKAVENLPPPEPDESDNSPIVPNGTANHGPISDDETAKKHNVSRQTLSRVKKVKSQGCRDLQEALRNKTVSLADAAKAASQPHAVQMAAIDAISVGKASTLEEAIKSNSEQEKACQKDPDGVEIPEEAGEAFQMARDMDIICREIDRLAHQVTDMRSRAGGEQILVSSITQPLLNAKHTLHACKPAYVCPRCKGKDMECVACRGRYWVTKSTWLQDPEIEKRKWGKA